MLSLVEITAFRLESKSCKINFPLMRPLKFITGHVIYNPAYNYKFQLKTTYVTLCLPASDELTINDVFRVDFL